MTSAVVSSGVRFDDLMPRTLEVGDRLKDFEFPDATGRRIMLDYLTLFGRPLVLHVTPATAEGAAALQALAAGVEPFGRLGIGVVALTRHGPDALFDIFNRVKPSFALLPDPPAQLFRYLDIDPEGRSQALVAGPDLRITHRLTGDPAQVVAAAALACERRLASRVEQLVAVQPPVLVLPDLLPAEACRRLIDHWHSRQDKMVDQVASGEAGRNVYDPGIKRRHDVPIDDPVADRFMSLMLKRRMLPEVERAFAYRIKDGEAMKIGCYDAETEGRFRPHRDNNNDLNRRRRFAMSLNLNDDFEGGVLRFPEYPGIIYKPAAGSAVVFSCSLLHEATAVTKGRRFGVFGFFW